MKLTNQMIARLQNKMGKSKRAAKNKGKGKAAATTNNNEADIDASINDTQERPETDSERLFRAAVASGHFIGVTTEVTTTVEYLPSATTGVNPTTPARNSVAVAGSSRRPVAADKPAKPYVHEEDPYAEFFASDYEDAYYAARSREWGESEERIAEDAKLRKAERDEVARLKVERDEKKKGKAPEDKAAVLPNIVVDDFNHDDTLAKTLAQLKVSAATKVVESDSEETEE